MYLLGLGLLLLILKWQAIGPVASLSWWWVLAPFAAAVLWWEWADWSGYTKRKTVEREERDHLRRINRQREAIGQKPRSELPPTRR